MSNEIEKEKKKKKKYNLPLTFSFCFSIFLTIYLINIPSPFGLIFWEIAFYFLIPCFIAIFFTLRHLIAVKKGLKTKHQVKLVVFAFIINIIFSIFAVVPFFYVNLLGQEFENEFKSVLGDDYWDIIPSKYQVLLKTPGNYFDRSDLSYFCNDNLNITRDIEYGSDTYQIFDMFKDESNVESNKPAFIYVHGGGSTTFTKKENGDNQCKYFASIGFVSFSIEYTSAVIEPFPKGIADVMKAIVYIKNHAEEYNIDNNSIVIYGESRGGHIITQTVYTGISNNNFWKNNGGNYTAEELKVACVIDLYGAVDQFYAAENNGFLASRNEIIFDGTPEEKQDLYSNHTVKNFINSSIPDEYSPTLIIHGSIDAMVQVGESQGLYEEMIGAGIDNVVYLEIPFGQHGLDFVSGTPGNLLTYYFMPRFALWALYK
ncbi:MAG: alpha/beta hydrolase [archaeon]|nr:alpha/beta hydrolase [archaeon]